MTVSELIDALNALPPECKNRPVHLYLDLNNKFNREVRDVIDNGFDSTVDLDNWPAEGYL